MGQWELRVGRTMAALGAVATCGGAEALARQVSEAGEADPGAAG